MSCRYVLRGKLLSLYACIYIYFFQRRFFNSFLYLSFLSFRFVFSRRFLLSYLKVLPEDFDFHYVTMQWFIPLRERFRRRFYRRSAKAARFFYAKFHGFYLLKWYDIFLLRLKSAKFEFVWLLTKESSFFFMMYGKSFAFTALKNQKKNWRLMNSL